jgi:GntR family transcriptional regulator
VLNLDIQPSLPIPIYRQVIDQVQRLIAGGGLRPGDELPSVRQLAERHAVNPMTISKAYSLLEAQGMLERRRGLGMVVSAQAAREKARDRLHLLQPALDAAAQQAQQLGIAPSAALQAFEQALRAQKPDPS